MWPDTVLRQEEKDVTLHEGKLPIIQEPREEKADSAKEARPHIGAWRGIDNQGDCW